MKRATCRRNRLRPWLRRGKLHPQKNGELQDCTDTPNKDSRLHEMLLFLFCKFPTTCTRIEFTCIDAPFIARPLASNDASSIANVCSGSSLFKRERAKDPSRKTKSLEELRRVLVPRHRALKRRLLRRRVAHGWLDLS